MNFSFHPEASAELDEAVAYYESRQPGLGLELRAAVFSGIARINQFPGAGGKISKRTRRALLNRFPYGLIYQIKSNQLIIIAVANLHRRPGWWKSRT